MDKIKLAFKHRVALTFILSLVIMCFYFLIGSFQFSRSGYIFISQFEIEMPTMPEFIYIYLSGYIFIIYSIKNMKEQSFPLFVLTALLTLIQCFIVYLLLPTIYPREFTIIEPINFSYNILWNLRKLDIGANCLPSIYIGIVLSSIYSSLNRNPFKVIGIVSYFLIFLGSVIVTKQNYAITIPFTILIVTTNYFISKKLLSRKNI